MTDRWRVFGVALLLCIALGGCARESTKEPVPPGPEQTQVKLLWDPDKPEELPPLDLGKVRPLELNPAWRVNGHYAPPIEFTLAIALPVAPTELPIYEVGNYLHGDRFTEQPPWFFQANYSLVWYDDRQTDPVELGAGTRTELATRLFTELGLLMPDTTLTDAVTSPNGISTIRFNRHLHNQIVYGDKPACIDIDASGRVTYMTIRRRPLVKRSTYPLRTPAEAWEALQAGGWYGLGSSSCQDGGVWWQENGIEQFEVTKIELAYWEPHADRHTQPMIPYYLFRNAEGHTLYVPAVKTEWLEEPA